jgi:Tfp pilus assembly protein PilN
MMWQKASKLASTYNNLKQRDSAYKWAQGKGKREIAKELKTLLSETEAVEKFLSTRIIWSDYLRDLPTRLPANVSLSNFVASCEFQETAEKDSGIRRKINKSLSLRGMNFFNEGQASPEEIEGFLESLKKIDLLKRDFPKVQLTEIKWRKEGKGEAAIFTVLASPEKAVKNKDKKDAKGEKGAKDSSKG